MTARYIDLTGSFGLRVAGRDAAEVRIGTAGRWGQRINLAHRPAPVSPDLWPSYSYRSVTSAAFVTHETLGPAMEATLTGHDPGGLTGGNTGLRLSQRSGGDSIPAAIGRAYRISVDAAVDAFYSHPDRQTVTCIAQPRLGGAIVQTLSTSAYVTGLEDWVRLTYVVTLTVAVDALSVVIARPNAQTIPLESRMWARHALIEDVTDLAAQWSALPDPKPTLDAWLDERLGSGYFDGSTEATARAIYHWTDRPHESTSVATLAWRPE